MAAAGKREALRRAPVANTSKFGWPPADSVTKLDGRRQKMPVRGPPTEDVRKLDSPGEEREKARRPQAEAVRRA